jgi:hypothetical protein
MIDEAELTATAATSGNQRQSATAQDTRTIHGNLDKCPA